ncbi:vacuolar protein-sorting-associated protein [Botrytis cinerea]
MSTFQTQTSVKTFKFPREHSFPPFFTLQPTSSTVHAQLRKWSDLILSYFAFHRLFRLTVSTLLSSELFKNERINRRLDEEGLREVLEFMRKEGRVEWIGGGGNGKVGGDICWVWWRKVDEWARVIEDWVDETGQRGSVLTLYELVEGEGGRGAEFHGLDTEILQKALAILVKRGKAQVFGQEDQQGVKFF